MRISDWSSDVCSSDLIADGVPRDAAFMLHQAVERAYNAVLLVLPLYAPKSHRLGILRSLAENLDSRLIEAWPRDTPAARRHFAQLQRASVASASASGREAVWPDVQFSCVPSTFNKKNN